MSHTRVYAKRNGLETYKGAPCAKGHTRRNTHTGECFYCEKPNRNRKEKETDADIMRRHKENVMNQRWI